MIKIQHVYKSFGKLEVLKDISLTIHRGEILAIVGPSGAGKTTLLQIAGTLDKPDRGSVEYEGKEVATMKDKKLSSFRNKNIGFVFQFHQLLAEFSALDNVAIPAMIGGLSKRKAREKAQTFLDRLGLSDRLHHKPGELSGGEKQRVAIARALVNDPLVVFADEPTGSLDSHNRDEIRQIISQLREELQQTFVIVTHDPTVASVADRIINIEDGKILEIKEESSVEINSPEIDIISEEL